MDRGPLAEAYEELKELRRQGWQRDTEVRRKLAKMVDDLGKAAIFDLSQRGCEAFPAVKQHDDAGQPLGQGHVSALLGDAAEPGGGKQFLPPAQLGGQALEQPGGALDLGTVHHRTAVG